MPLTVEENEMTEKTAALTTEKKGALDKDRGEIDSNQG